MKKQIMEWLLAGSALAAALGAAAVVVSLLPHVADKPRILQCAAVPQPISFADATVDPRFFHQAKADAAKPVLKPAKARR